MHGGGMKNGKTNVVLSHIHLVLVAVDPTGAGKGISGAAAQVGGATLRHQSQSDQLQAAV